jgi:hypothetical protein
MPVVTSFIVKIARLPADDRSRAVRQIKHLIARLPIDDQPELPLYEPGSVAADEGSIFDKTGAGEAQAAERGDDPGKAGKRKSAEPPAAPKDTGALSPEEAKAAFEKTKDKVVPLRGTATEQLAAANAEDEKFLRDKRKDPLAGAEGTGTYAVS